MSKKILEEKKKKSSTKPLQVITKFSLRAKHEQ